jgi:hypothetical protein
MYTIIILMGLAYVVYHAFKAGKRIGSQKGYAAGRLGGRSRRLH